MFEQKNFGENVKLLLDKKGMTQNELASKIVMSSSGISTALKSSGNPRIRTVIQIANELGCSLDYLFTSPQQNKSFTPYETDLLNVFSLLNVSGQKVLLKNAEALLEIPEMRQEGSIASMA